MPSRRIRRGIDGSGVCRRMDEQRVDSRAAEKQPQGFSSDFSFCVKVNGHELSFQTGSSCFSPQSADKGTLAMLSCVTVSEGQRVLDLGCGYGLVGIYAAKCVGESSVYMTDIHEQSLCFAWENARRNGVSGVHISKSDGFRELKETEFDVILSNPPYHTDFSVAKHFLEKGFNRLAIGGHFYMVTKRKEWYKNKFISLFGGVKIHEVDGYFVFDGEKRASAYAKAR